MIKDVYVQVLNPKSKRYVLINKTKGIIVGTKRDDKPFSDVEIIESIKVDTINEKFACGGSISSSLKNVMESVPEFVESKNTVSEWDGSRYKKCSVKWHKKVDIDTLQKVSVGSKYVKSSPYQKGKTWTKYQCADMLFHHGKDIYVGDMKISISAPKSNEENSFGDAVKKAMKMNEKSLADEAYDKFKDDEYKHTRKLRETLRRIAKAETYVTAYDVKASMIIMWELLQKGYIEDVTPAARTGGATTPDITYCYKITPDGRIFIMGWAQ